MKKTTVSHAIAKDFLNPERETPINLSPKQASKRLNTSTWTIYKLNRTGELPYYHIGRLRRIPIEAIHSYQAAQLAKAKLGLERV